MRDKGTMFESAVVRRCLVCIGHGLQQRLGGLGVARGDATLGH